MATKNLGINSYARNRLFSFTMPHLAAARIVNPTMRITSVPVIPTKKGKDKLLGVTIVGPHAGDLLHELVLAMHQNIGLKKVASMIHVFPTLAEISKRIADTYQRTRLTPGLKKWFKRYFNWRLG